MNAASQPLVRVEHLLHCFGGGAVDSIVLVISDSPMVLALLKHSFDMDDFSPLELYFEMTFEPFKAELRGYFNRPAGHRLRETLQECIGKQWRWQPPRRSRSRSYKSGGSGRVTIPVQRLWFSWDSAEPHPASEQDLQAFATEHSPVNGTQGFCNDKLLIMTVTREPLDTPEVGAQSKLTQLIAKVLTDSATR